MIIPSIHSRHNICRAPKCIADAVPGQLFCKKCNEKRTEYWNAKKAARKSKRYVVYFLRQGKSGPILIGQTGQWKKLKSTLQAASPRPIEVLSLLECDTASEMARIKERLHRSLADYRVSRGWFRPTEDVMTIVRMAASKPEALQACLTQRIDNEEVPE